MYKRILVPVDLDRLEHQSKALNIAAHIARDSEATAVYASIVDAVPTPSTVTEAERYEQRLKELAAQQEARHGISVSEEVAPRGDLHLRVGSDIVELAQKSDCDLIVMGSHIPGFKDHILASNAGYVATHAPMSVYVVR